MSYAGALILQIQLLVGIQWPAPVDLCVEKIQNGVAKLKMVAYFTTAPLHCEIDKTKASNPYETNVTAAANCKLLKMEG